MANISIAPNSGQPIYTSLINLSTDDIMSIVLSNKCPLRFVKFNSIILEHWNDIFSSARYIWKVVRKNPYAVKIWLPSHECLVCKPDNQNLYQPTLLAISGRRSPKLKKQKKPVSLKDAVQICENYLDNNHFDRNSPALLKIEPKYSIDDKGNKHPLFTIDTPDDLLGSTGQVSEEIINYLKKDLGVSDDDIQFIKSNYKPTEAYELKKILTADKEPVQSDIDDIIKRKLYAEPDLLSQHEVDQILNANEKPRKSRRKKSK